MLDFMLGDWSVQPHAQRLVRGGETVRLQARPMQVLVYLSRHADRAVSRDELVQQVWGVGHVSDQAVQSVISTLRQSLGDDRAHPHYLQTVRHQGYRMIADIRMATQPVSRSRRLLETARERPGVLFAGLATLAILALLLLSRSGPGWDDLTRFLQDNPGNWDIIVEEDETQTDPS